MPVRQLVEDFARYCYLPRLQRGDVLLNAIRDGIRLLTWERDSFAYAEGFDEGASRYRGIKAGQDAFLTADDAGLLVKPEVARRQLDAEAASPPPPPAPLPRPGERPPDTSTTARGPAQPKRFHGTVLLDSARAGRDASHVADEVITHLVGLPGAKVRVTLEIESDIPNGAPDNVVRTVTENARTLKFTSQGFERE